MTASQSKALIAVTTCPLVRPCTEAIVQALIERGHAVKVYETDGQVGRTLEADVLAGRIAAVFDLSLTELAAELIGTGHGAGPDRLTAAALRGIPQVIVPGALDAFVCDPTCERERAGKRRTAEVGGVRYARTTPEENDRHGREIANKASAARGPTVIMLPLGGLSALDGSGLPFHWPAANQALFQSLRNWLSPSVRLVEEAAHINGPPFAASAINALAKID